MANLSTLAALGGLLTLAGAARAQTFAPVATYPSRNDYPAAIATGDINRDGKPDLLTAGFSNGLVTSLLGTGTGSFQAGGYDTMGGTATGIAVGYLNNDNYPDVAATGSVSSSVSVLLGTSSGTFPSYTRNGTGISSAPQGVALADVDSDGKLDLLTANTGTSTAGVFRNTGNGTFQPMTAYFTGTNSRPSAITAGDMNNDGKPDLLTANGSNSTISLLLGTGTGTFQAVITYSAGNNSYPTGIAVADVNGDGKLDVLTANLYSDNVGVLLGTSAGTLQPVVTYTTGVNTGPGGIAVADINGDGRPDLVTANGNNSTTGVLLGNGNGTFQPAVSFATGSGSGPSGIVAVDVNGDGKPDLCTTNANANTVNVLLNTTPLPVRASLPGASASLAPNPAGAATMLHVAGLPAAVAQVQATVLDATGREVARHLLPARAGSIQAELPIAGLAPGLYVVRLLGYDGQGGLLGELPALRLGVE